MASDRLQGQMESLFDEAGQAFVSRYRNIVRHYARDVLDLTLTTRPQ